MINYKTLTADLEFPEGPVAMEDGSVIVCEIKAQRLTRVYPDGTKTTVAQLEGAPNGAAFGADGALYICNNGDGFLWGAPGGMTQPVGGSDTFSGGRIERVDIETGEVTELYRTIGGNDLLMPNDIVVARDGSLYFTDHGMRTARSFLHGGAYWGAPDGSEAREIAYPITTANGIGLSPDEETLYVSETETGRLWYYQITGQGTLAPTDPSNPSATMLAQLEGFKRYDSLAVEECGNICVAGLTPGCITVISPEGKEVETIEMPDPFSTNICFGGDDMKTAYITLSGTGRLIEMQWPRPGLRLNFQRF
ncbi:MAG: gluconolaconase [Rhodobacteraceae bacterium]|nr:MAG: gluconolaconase [Paracoccaceae bacterium]